MGKNRLAECICDKVAEAILNGREFKLIIIIPQHPEGGFYTNDMTTAYIMHLQYQTISRGGNSLLERIRQRFPMDIELDLGGNTQVTVSRWLRCSTRLEIPSQLKMRSHM